MYLLPKPNSIQYKSESFAINHSSYLVFNHAGNKHIWLYASMLKECIKEFAGMEIRILCGEKRRGDIALTFLETLEEQEYQLLVEPDGIQITGGSETGILYGVQTLCQIIEQFGTLLPCVEIKDKPEIKHRGYFLDQTRGRVLKLKELKKFADVLCRYKINEFHLYVEHTYLFRDLSEMWRDETPLTAEEILELDGYCRERHIDLVPTLASFGHLYKLLSTKSYEEFCELENSSSQPFSFWDRMRHHTINISNSRSREFIRGLLKEYMSLFSSKKFNLCADETFDLGKGKAKPCADSKGVHQLYIEFVRELCEFVLENGKTPMFWGDIICAQPELIHELPKETICMTWGYAPEQRDYEARVMAEAGATQYICPGVCGWNQWVHLIENSYKNITLLCSYAEKYKAIGILNTDWGDAGHINQPELSIPGLIYGAAFSWNNERIEFEEMNRQISVLHYKDSKGEFVQLLSEVPQYSLFQWWDAVVYEEANVIKNTGEQKTECYDLLQGDRLLQKKIDMANQKLNDLEHKLRKTCFAMDISHRSCLFLCVILLDGIRVWNNIGGIVSKKERKEPFEEKEAYAAAEQLEQWFMTYKELWRKTCKEGDLLHISRIVFWYADLLRGRIIEQVKVTE